jgi:DNA-binding transcriptional ArsR family regulator
MLVIWICFDYHQTMDDTPDIASIAALVADPTRAAMLTLLMDGKAYTATELAVEGDVMPSTASIHLAKLHSGGLIAATRQGRHRYFRISAPEVAAILEGLMIIATNGKRHVRRTGPVNEEIRRSRICYDHLAGEVAVQLLERIRDKQFISGEDQEMLLTKRGEDWCGRIGIDLTALRSKRRRICRACLDWSERRVHLAGALGAAILDRLFTLGYAEREVGSRVVILSPQGERFIAHLELPH